jgi:ABC-2 type transport system permease protein
MKLLKLIENEIYKTVYKKRLLIIFGILLILITSFAYGEKNSLNRTKERLAERIGITATTDWKKLLEQQILDLKNRLESSSGNNQHIEANSEHSPAAMLVNLNQLKYFLENNINPLDSSSAKFTTRFMEQAIFLFLPLLMIVLAADMVSGEAADGTIKLLLTRNVPRWKILLSKYIALLIMQIFVIVMAAVLAVVISGIFFGYGGWMTPVATGFRVVGDQLNTDGVTSVPLWQYMFMVYGLGFYVSVVVGAISFMISVLVRSTPASIGIMMASLIGGNFMSFFLADWEMTRYLFMVNLRLTDYLSGSFQPIIGMNMAFSIYVLLAWMIGALVISFTYFNKQDILV